MHIPRRKDGTDKMTGFQFVEFEIGGLGISYVRSKLRDGNKLSEYLLRNIVLEKGKITTYLPQNVTRSSLYEFDSAVLKLPPKEKWRVGKDSIAVPVVGTANYDGERINSILQSRSDSIFLIEDIFADKDSSYLKNLNVKVAFLDKEVIYFANNSDGAPGITKTLQAGNNFYGGAGIISTSQIFNKSPMRLNDHEIDELTRRATHLIIGAYDGDGYLWWTKEGSVGPPPP